MKIYTKTGDDGTTGLVGGARIRKDDVRIDCYGTIDELNAAVGMAAVSAVPFAGAGASDLLARLRAVQAELFIIGSHLATPADSKYKATLPPLPQAAIARLEQEIDSAEADLPQLRHFILPGGCEASARLHLVRTICRRAERLVVALSGQSGGQEDLMLVYLNRLSDWAFVHARWANHHAGLDDIPWIP